MKKTIYLYKSGTLTRRDESLCLIEKNNKVHYIPVLHIDCIFCFGEITVNKRVYALCNKYGVSIHYYNYYGQYIGRFIPHKEVTGKDMIEQINAYSNQTTRLTIAKEITLAELKNMLALVKYYKRTIDSLESIVNRLDLYIIKTELVITIDQLLILEAQAKRCYYEAFDIILGEDSPYHFIRRMTYTESNEVNCMMSYGYALLYGSFLSAIDQSPLMPNISFIHSISKTSDSLKFDLADILKPAIVDRTVLSLIKRNKVDDTCFKIEKGKTLLNKKGITILINSYEGVLSRSVLIDHKDFSYKNIISREVYKLHNYIIHKTDSYDPYVMGW